MKKIISYALFGDGSYARFLPAVIRAHLTLFPPEEGWVMRLHHDYRLDTFDYSVVLRSLYSRGLIELRRMEQAPLCKAMMWRMAPLFEDTTDVVFCRDLDSLPTPRDRACCEEFLASDAIMHTIHDRDVHDGMMGGLSGFKAKLRERLADEGTCRLEELWQYGAEIVEEKLGAIDWDKKGADQNVLNYFLAPHFRVLVHHQPGRSHLGGFAQAKYDVEWRPTPQVGTALLPTMQLLQAEALSPFLGAAGFDVDAAVKFYDGLRKATRALGDIADAEAWSRGEI